MTARADGSFRPVNWVLRVWDPGKRRKVSVGVVRRGVRAG